MLRECAVCQLEERKNHTEALQVGLSKKGPIKWPAVGLPRMAAGSVDFVFDAAPEPVLRVQQEYSAALIHRTSGIASLCACA